VRLYEQARQAGEQAIRDGRVAGLSCRPAGRARGWSFDGPKGAFPISPVRDATLFQLFADTCLGVQRRWVHRPRWTS